MTSTPMGADRVGWSGSRRLRRRCWQGLALSQKAAHGEGVRPSPVFVEGQLQVLKWIRAFIQWAQEVFFRLCNGVVEVVRRGGRRAQRAERENPVIIGLSKKETGWPYFVWITDELRHFGAQINSCTYKLIYVFIHTEVWCKNEKKTYVLFTS